VKGKDYLAGIYVVRRITLKAILEIRCEDMDCLVTGKIDRLL
jgi:hypothetical protein